MAKNHHLAKSISDAGWNKIVQYTICKAESAGNIVVPVDPNTHHRHVQNAASPLTGISMLQ